ncbi:recombinase family protein [Clostridium botulinum]|uniref:Recombinase n=1 Tax=Clostridium botulinum (strain Kyoto / Type A2) TaxID=536232 RepID=C1FPY4_CLOBJ|nr:recombinase family protein [Clostridium botulinum]ACO86158.1 recombinase [Clostridium botulinum A2 str. Kyoto]AUN07227.1 resolvase [Clostridium botulinum]MBN3364508.1 resolvase [Clostridium botulinum]MBN3376080.1 resolvase [Clostridium botulinum]MBN3385264.1 resolvase [Clostridium botulinum]
MIFGYMRISTQKEKQTTDRQRITLEQYAAANKFLFDELIEERIYGTIQADHRLQYNNLKSKLRKDDILIITDIDRLGRSANDVIMEFKKLKADGIRVIALDTPYLNEWEKVQDSSLYNMIADIFITLKAHMAQQEREKTVSRINQGLAVARAKGKQLGRPKADLPKDFIKEYNKFKDGGYGDMSAMSFAKMLGIGRSTLYKYIKLYEEV